MSEIYSCPQCIDPETMKPRILKSIGWAMLCTDCEVQFIPDGDKWLADRAPLIEELDL